MIKILLATAAAVVALAGCGGSAHVAASKPKADPTKACLQLQNFGLHNHGQGISKAFGRTLEQETAASPMHADVVQWLQDLAAPVPSPSNAAAGIKQVLGDAAVVSSDCMGYGVRNVLGSS
jgi:hypothetical protein